jgi:PelA/Pel-15E family pectate lyase
MKTFIFFAIVFLLSFPTTIPAVAEKGFHQFNANEKPNIVVATDGSGDVKTVQEAIDRVPENNKKRFVIFIKQGVYKEQIKVPANKPYISFIGEKAESAKLTFNLTNRDTGSTSASYSAYIGGHDFYAENITFENSFGTGSQAVAVLVEADRIIFKNCRFLGWQDTLYAKGGRQFYQNCYIEGHVDFIFGQATAVFENCHIHSKGDGYIAAPMRFSETEPTGYVFIRSKLTGENINKGVFLGRPWRAYGRTVFLETEMDAHIRPEGWDNWRDPAREKTAYFAEYKSTGKGANPTARVKWAHQLTDEEAKAFRAEPFLKGADNWSPYKIDFKWQEKTPPDFKLVNWTNVLKQSKDWYAVDEATRIADNTLLYQRDNGGWEKNVDMSVMLTQKEKEAIAKRKSETDTTIDNGATYTQLVYLAKVITAKNIDRHKAAFNKGLDFLLSMQYENGGFPQFFPLQNNYSRYITYNDNAMINALKLLRDVAEKKSDYTFVDEERRARAEKAVQKGIEVILKTQVVVKGQKTVWCAQHDEKTFMSAPARTFEPISLSGLESVQIVEFLMRVKEPDQRIVEAIESAVKWFEKSKLTGIKVVEKPDNKSPKGFDRVVIKDAKAQPLWARFYEIETNRPIFAGRDGVVRYNYAEIEIERRAGYGYYTLDPNELLNVDYPKWQQRLTAKQGRN